MSTTAQPLDVDAVRSRFPALAREDGDGPAAYLDGPAGTQVPIGVIDAMAGVMRRGVGNLGGRFAASHDAEEITVEARAAIGDLFGAPPSQIAFGQNMTSLTFAVSRAIATEWAEGDEIVITALDHDANVTPWRRAAAERGVSVRTVPFSPETGALDIEALRAVVGERTRLVAVTCASNALGTVTPIDDIVGLAHHNGALVYADAVHFAPHRLLDVEASGVDFAVASAYKFFGPHTGALYGRADHFERLQAYKVDPAPDSGPGKWETGTQSFASLAGVTAAVDYLAGLGSGEGRRQRLIGAFAAIRAHEDSLAGRFLSGVAEIPKITVYGPNDASRPGDRVSTFAIAVDGVPPSTVASHLGRRGIYVWDGHYYAVSAMRHLGVLDDGGLVRIGFVHYTTPGEVDRVLTALEELPAG